MTYLHFAQAIFGVVDHLLQRFEISYGSHVAKNGLGVQRDEICESWWYEGDWQRMTRVGAM